jgi:hypothetical protein
VHHGVTLVGARCDVKKGNLVGTLLVIAARDLYWIAGITDIHESNTLDYAASIHIQARNNTLGESHILKLNA